MIGLGIDVGMYMFFNEVMLNVVMLCFIPFSRSRFLSSG